MLSLKSLSLKSIKSTFGEWKFNSPSLNFRSLFPNRTSFLKLGKLLRSRAASDVNLPEFSHNECSLGRVGNAGGSVNLLPYRCKYCKLGNGGKS